MLRYLRIFIACGAICAVVGMAATSSYAELVITAGLGADSENDDIHCLTGVISTKDDGTSGGGHQQTAVQFVGLLDSVADILTPTASFTLEGLTPSGPATTFFGSTVIQDISGGQLKLYDASNALLLQASLSLSGLTGPMMPPGAGGLFTTYVDGPITGGSLAGMLENHTLRVEMHLPIINGGAGFSITPSGGIVGTLNPFEAGAFVEISAIPVIPEPASGLLLLTGSMAAAAFLRRRKRR